VLRLITLSDKHTHTLGRTPLEEGSARRRDVYLQETQHSQETDIRAPSEIRTRNSSKRPVADRDQQIVFYLYEYLNYTCTDSLSPYLKYSNFTLNFALPPCL